MKIIYRTQNGPVDVSHEIEEIEEAHDIVERGPHWDTITRIIITPATHSTDSRLTVEASERL
jgi:hypothetical protein